MIKRELRGTNWDVIDIAPFEELQEYPAWLRENEVTVMVLDERLNEIAVDSESAVSYAGHNLAVFLRNIIPDLPQFIVTNVPDTPELGEAAGTLDGIIQRADFRNKVSVYVERMVRAGLSFSERFKSELHALDEISQAVVLGTATDSQLSTLGSLRGKIQFETLLTEGVKLAESTEQLEDLCNRLERTLEDLQRKPKP
ncbi:hypothetical protein AE932_11335 [Xanthomonas arboricola]|nr:hypothetical protein AE932_11335 [Xanthomonas arboricola]